MFGFGKKHGTYLESDFNEAETDTNATSVAEATSRRFNETEYEKIFTTLSMEDLHSMSAERLAGLAALTFAATEDLMNSTEGDEIEMSEFAADYARASALGNLALLKNAGVAFDTQL